MERRVRSAGRPVYGGQLAYRRPAKKPIMRPKMSGLQVRLVILGVLALLVVYFVWHSFAIKSVTLTGVVASDKLNAEATKLVSSSMGQGNLLTFDSGKFESDLQQVDPRIKTISLMRSWPHGIAIHVVLKQPTLGWSSNGSYYILDVDGTAIGVLPAGSALPVVTDNSNLPVTIGQIVAPEQFVGFASMVTSQLAPLNISVRSMYVTDTTLDLNVVTSAGWRLIFDTSRPIGGEISDLKTVMATMASQHATPAQYIDLRIQGRAYWQ